MDRLDDKAMATNQALETLCFFCSCAPVATGITQIHFEMGGGITNRSHGLSSLYETVVLKSLNFIWQTKKIFALVWYRNIYEAGSNS